jgi:pimeloyl-ACP methyl ester carboxylesterase
MIAARRHSLEEASRSVADLIELGGEGSVLHFAPANGFPPGAYRQLAGALSSRFQVLSLLPRPLWPGSSPSGAPTWHTLAHDLVRGLDALGLRGIAAVGHSIGGVLTLWAALDRPDLFRAVVLVDPVILPPAWLRSLSALRALGLERRQPLVRGTLHRRWLFPDRRACFDHYRARPLFARLSDAALWDYVDAGTRLRPDGQLELVYPPEWEAHIFATTPLDVWRGLDRLRIPALVIRGEESAVFVSQAQARLQRLLPAARFVTLPGAGHLAPFEQPDQVAALLHRFLDEYAA